MPAGAWPTLRAAAPNAVPRTGSPIEGCAMALAEGAAGCAITNRARCTAPSVRAVGRRRRCLFSRAVIDLSIAVPVTRRSTGAERTTAGRTGNIHDRDCRAS